MQKIPFSESEFEIRGEYLNTTFSFGAPRKIWNTPITVAENLKAAVFGGEYMFMPTAGDIVNIESRVNLDHVARAEIMDLGPLQPLEEKGGPDLFGIEWVFVPQVGGSMVKPGDPTLTDANEWYDKIKFPDVDALDWDSVGELNAPFKKETRVVGCCFQNGLFERLISFMDFAPAAMALIDEEQQDAVKELFQATTDFACKLVDKLCETWPMLDGFNIHDDWGAQKAPFFSEEVAYEFFVPFMRQLTGHIHARGRYATLHSCGHVDSRVQCFIDGGFDEWDPQLMNDIHGLYERWGDKIVLGVWPDQFDPEKTSLDEQRERAREFVRMYSQEGKPVIFGHYGRFAQTEAFTEEVYKASRLRYGG